MSLTLEQLQKNSFGAPYRDNSWRGLSLRQLCEQSRACHADWTIDDIRQYAVTEESFDPAVVHAAPVELWVEDSVRVLASHLEVLQHGMACTAGCVVRTGVVGGSPFELDAEYWVGFNVGATPVAVELAGPWLTREQLQNCG